MLRRLALIWFCLNSHPPSKDGKTPLRPQQPQPPQHAQSPQVPTSAQGGVMHEQTANLEPRRANRPEPKYVVRITVSIARAGVSSRS